MPDQLAIEGGRLTLPNGMVAKWPPIDDRDRDRVLASLGSDAFLTHSFGPNCRAFQDEFAQWNGNAHALATNSGTAALHMALAACGCRPGDEVIVPAFSWSSSATSVLHHNAIPVFVDIDLATMNLDLDQVEQAITPRTRAILVVHLHGLMADMERVMEIADRHGLYVVEDACQAHGSRFKGRKAGTWGHCAAFSLNQNKLLSAGEGGVFVTDDEELLKRAAQVWSFGETGMPDSAARDRHVHAMGWMYRMADLTAAFARSQLEKLDHYIESQRANADTLRRQLDGVPGLRLPVEPKGHRTSWYNFVVRIDPEALGRPANPRGLRDAMAAALYAEGIPDILVWQSFILPAMTLFQARDGYGRGCPWSCHGSKVEYAVDRFPNAQQHCDTHFVLGMVLREPNGPAVVEQVAWAIDKVVANVSRLEISD